MFLSMIEKAAKNKDGKTREGKNAFAVTFRRGIKVTLKFILAPLARFVHRRPGLKRSVTFFFQRFPFIGERMYRLFHEQDAPLLDPEERVRILGELPPRGRRLYELLHKNNRPENEDPN